jgi:hypothetical protein
LDGPIRDLDGAIRYLDGSIRDLDEPIRALAGGSDHPRQTRDASFTGSRGAGSTDEFLSISEADEAD